VPEIGDELIDLPARLRSDPETEQYRLFDAVAGWLAAVSAQSPALLVLDDLHWATAPTVLLLRHLVRWSDPVRLMIIGTYRNSELAPAGALGQLLADLRGAPGVERVELCGLDEPDVRALVRSSLSYARQDLTAIEASDGDVGLKVAREQNPDVIILDLQMPTIDGFTVLQELTADSRTSVTPVIVSTSMNVNAELKARLPAGTRVISKNTISRENVSLFLRDATAGAP